MWDGLCCLCIFSFLFHFYHNREAVEALRPGLPQRVKSQCMSLTAREQTRGGKKLELVAQERDENLRCVGRVLRLGEEESLWWGNVSTSWRCLICLCARVRSSNEMLTLLVLLFRFPWHSRPSCFLNKEHGKH